jgi:tripartite-type tricarboxylate transporter receptor subunit TctC
MKLTRRVIFLTAAAAMIAPLSAMAQDLPRNIRMVIGSTSTGGDTYQSAAILADALSEQLGVNVKVDAVGPSEGLKALGRDSRGTTIMMFHDQAFLQNLYGVQGSSDIFSEFAVGPTIAINPANAYLVPKNSPYQSMSDLLAAAESGSKIRVAIQPGGVSEIGFTAMKNAARLNKPGSEANIVAVNTGSQSDKNQALFDGLADVINGSIQSNEQFTQLPAEDQKAMRFIWLTSSPEALAQAPEAGMGNTTRAMMLDYAAPKVSVPFDARKDFVFDKEFFLIYNKDMAPAQMDAIDAALTAIYAKGDIQKRQTEAFFTPDLRLRAEGAAHLQQKNDDYAGIISTLKGN